MSLRDKIKSLIVKKDRTVKKNRTVALQGETRPIVERKPNPIVAAKPTVQGFQPLKKASVKNLAGDSGGSIGFIIDATASRVQAWEEAKSIQIKMFEGVAGIGSMSLRLVHFGGEKITDTGWKEDSTRIASHMARIECLHGLTQILNSLKIFLNDDATGADSIIIVGDAFEELIEEVAPLARELKERKIKAFTFLDGHDKTTEKAFKLLSNITGGAFAKFGAAMPLEDLCKGVALMSVGGNSALQKLENSAAKQLLLTSKPE